MSYCIFCKVYNYLIDIDLNFLIQNAIDNGQYSLALYYESLLTDEQYHINVLANQYKDTYDFLMSLQDGLSNISYY